MTCKCIYCDEKRQDVIPATGVHAYGEWSIVTPATCGENGWQKRICDVCKNEDNCYIPETGKHDFKWTLEYSPTCNDGYEGYGEGWENGVCNNCGTTTGRSIPAIEDKHEYSTWETEVAATCMWTGREISYCDKCGTKTFEDTPVIDHDMDKYWQCAMCHKGLVYEYNEETDSYCVTHCTMSYGVPLTIPAYYNEKPVASIGTDAFIANNATEVTIPATVKGIGANAFRQCNSITRVNILGEGLESIGNGAFLLCSKLEYINIPKSIESIDIEAFTHCNRLQIHIPDLTVWFNVIIVTESDTVCGPLYYAKLYSDGELVENLTIPDDISVINPYLFREYNSLKSVVIPDHVVSIGAYAFSYCNNLTDITIGKGVTEIGDCAFIYCNALEKINYNAVKCSAFLSSPFASSGKDSNIALKIGNAVESIPDYLLTIGGVASNHFPNIASIVFEEDSVCTSIGSGAFYGNSQLTSLTIPDSVMELGLSHLESLTSLTIPAWLLENAPNKFHLKKVTITSGEIGTKDTTFETAAFASNTSIRTVIINDGVTSIGNYAFYMCSALTSVIIADSVEYIGERAFFGCSLLTGVELPDNLTSIGSQAFYGCTNLESAQLPDNLTSIGSYVFYGCSSLKSIAFPSGLTSIGSFAFYGCSSLKSIALPSGLTSIGKSAFEDCSGVTGTVVIPSSLESIESGIFCGCKNITGIIILCNVTVIGNSAFSGCTSLNSVVIPATVQTIEGAAFGYFENNGPVKYVFYGGTADSWNTIEFTGIGTVALNEHLRKAPRYYYSETLPYTSGNYWHYVDGVPTVWAV